MAKAENTKRYRTQNNSFSPRIKLRVAICIVYICLVIQLTFADAANNQNDSAVTRLVRQKRGRLTRPDGSGEITKLKNEIRRADETINQLRSDSRVDKEQIATLQAELDKVKLEVDDLNRSHIRDQDALLDKVQQFSAEINRLNSRIELLSVENRPLECIKNIENRNFEAAVQLIETMVDEDEIERIVYRALGGRIRNFSTVLEFAARIRNTRISFIVHKALAHELRELGPNDVEKAIQLVEAIRTNIYDRVTSGTLIHHQSKLLTDEMTDGIGTVLGRQLKEQLWERNNNEIERLSNLLFDMPRWLYKASIKNTISSLFGTLITVWTRLYGETTELEAWRVMEIFENHPKWHVEIPALIAIFDELKKTNRLTNETMRIISTRIQDLKANYKYRVFAMLERDLTRKFDQMDSEIPRNIPAPSW